MSLEEILAWIDWKLVPDSVLERAADEFMRRFGDKGEIDELERRYKL